jgi:hypothetical protein
VVTDNRVQRLSCRDARLSRIFSANSCSSVSSRPVAYQYWAYCSAPSSERNSIPEGYIPNASLNWIPVVTRRSNWVDRSTNTFTPTSYVSSGVLVISYRIVRRYVAKVLRDRSSLSKTSFRQNSPTPFDVSGLLVITPCR